jgi:hypothetical protein
VYVQSSKTPSRHVFIIIVFNLKKNEKHFTARWNNKNIKLQLGGDKTQTNYHILCVCAIDSLFNHRANVLSYVCCANKTIDAYQVQYDTQKRSKTDTLPALCHQSPARTYSSTTFCNLIEQPIDQTAKCSKCVTEFTAINAWKMGMTSPKKKIFTENTHFRVIKMENIEILLAACRSTFRNS